MRGGGENFQKKLNKENQNIQERKTNTCEGKDRRFSLTRTV